MKCLSLIGVVFLATVAPSFQDEFLYDLRGWVAPVFKQVTSGAMMEMVEKPRLTTLLHSKSQTLDAMEDSIREKLASHLSTEIDDVLIKAQRLIDIVKDFSMELVNNFHETVSQMNYQDAETKQAEVGRYLDALVLRAKSSIKQILLELDYDLSETVEDHLSGKVFEEMAIKIAREFVKGADFKIIEETITTQVEKLLKAIFEDEDSVLEKTILSDMKDDVRQMMELNVLSGKEKEVKQWLIELSVAAVQGAKPQIQLLQGYAKQVLSEVHKLCHGVCYTAYTYFEDQKGDLGEVWDRIESIVKTIVEQDPTI